MLVKFCIHPQIYAAPFQKRLPLNSFPSNVTNWEIVCSLITIGLVHVIRKMNLSCCGSSSVPFSFFLFFVNIFHLKFDTLQIKLGLHLKKLFQKLWPILMLPLHFKIQEFKRLSWMYALRELFQFYFLLLGSQFSFRQFPLKIYHFITIWHLFLSTVFSEPYEYCEVSKWQGGKSQTSSDM